MPLRVSDHAVLRYLERFHGVDVERARAELHAFAAPIHAVGAAHGPVGELWLIIKNDTVITMTPNRPHFRSILKSDAGGLNGTDKRAPRQDFNWRMRSRKRAHK